MVAPGETQCGQSDAVAGRDLRFSDFVSPSGICVPEQIERGMASPQDQMVRVLPFDTDVRCQMQGDFDLDREPIRGFETVAQDQPMTTMIKDDGSDGDDSHRLPE